MNALDFLEQEETVAPTKRVTAAYDFLDSEEPNLQQEPISGPLIKPVDNLDIFARGTEASTIYGGPPKELPGVPFRAMMPDIVEAATTPSIPLAKFQVNKDDSVPMAVGKSVANILIGIPEFISSPVGAGITALAPVAPTAVAAGFSLDMLKSLGEQVYSSIKNWNEMSNAERAAAVTDMAGTGAFAWLTGTHAVKGFRGTPGEFQGPIATGEALRMPEGAKPPPVAEIAKAEQAAREVSETAAEPVQLVTPEPAATVVEGKPEQPKITNELESEYEKAARSNDEKTGQSIIDTLESNLGLKPKIQVKKISFYGEPRWTVFVDGIERTSDFENLPHVDKSVAEAAAKQATYEFAITPFQKDANGNLIKLSDLFKEELAKQKPTEPAAPAEAFPTEAVTEVKPAAATPETTAPAQTKAVAKVETAQPQAAAPEKSKSPVSDWTSATEEAPSISKPEPPRPAEPGPEISERYAGIPLPKFVNRKMSQLDQVTTSHSGKMQKSMSEARRAQKEIKKAVPNERRQAAISVWLEANGNTATLQTWERAAKGKLFRQAAADAQTLTAQEVAIANKARIAFDVLYNRGTHYDVLKSHRDDYVPHVWKVSHGATGWGGGMLQQRFKFSKARTFNNFFEGDQAGFIPRTLAIGRLLPTYIHSMNKVIADRQFVQEMNGRMAKDGRPLMLPRGNAKTVDATEYAVVNTPGGRAVSLHDTLADATAAAGPGQIVETRPGTAALVAPRGFANAKDAAGNPIEQGDYRTMENQPALHNWRWVTSDPNGNTTILKSDMALHPEAYRRLNSMLGQSAIRAWYRDPVTGAAQIPRTVVRGLDKAQAVMKQEMFGLLAPFHQVQEGTHAIGHLVNPFFAIPKVDMRNPAMMDAANHGLMLLPDRTTSSYYLEGVGTKSSLLSKGLRKLTPAGRAMSDVIDGYQDYLFHQYIPGIKFKTYEAMLRRNTKLYNNELASGEMTMKDVKLTSAEQANAAYGHLNYALLDRNPTIQHIIQMAALAPDFLEARGRFTAQGIEGLTSKVGHEQFKAIAVLAATQAGSAAIISQLLGVPYDTKHPFEVVYKGRRYAMRSVPEDIYGFLKDRNQFIYSRVNPLLVKGGIQALTGLNYRGEKVDALDTMAELMAGYIPITARSIPAIRSLTATTRNNPVSPLQQLAGSLGLRISRYSPVSETYKLAGNWMDAMKMERSKGSYPISKYQQLRYALEDLDIPRAQQEYDNLRQTMTPEQISRGFKQSMSTPFTGKQSTDEAFARSLQGYDRELYDLAVKTRKNILLQFSRFER